MDNYKFGLGELSFDNYNNLITISEYTEHNLNNNVIKLKKNSKSYQKLECDNENLIAWYKFDNNLKDSSGNNNHIIGNNDFINNNITNAVYFNGTNTDYLQVSDTSEGKDIDLGLIQQNNGISFSFWFYHSGELNNKTIFKTSQTSTYFYIRQNSTFSRMSIEYTSGTGTTQLFASITNKQDKWNHCVFTINSGKIIGNVETKFYLNGRLEPFISGLNGILDPKIAIPTGHTLKNAYFGGHSTTGTHGFWKGHLNDFRIYDKVLDINEIIQLYSYETLYINCDITCDILLVAGGGGGGARKGYNAGGGGGAGEVLYKKNINLKKGKYYIKIGSGGEGQNLNFLPSNEGRDTELLNENYEILYHVKGGGRGGYGQRYDSYMWLPTDGGSGGGIGRTHSYSRGKSIKYNIDGYGNDSGNAGSLSGGSGGGADMKGLSGIKPDGNTKDYSSRTNGITLNISGEEEYFASGGSGGWQYNHDITNVGYGSGGYGCAATRNESGFSGGGDGIDGIIIIKYYNKSYFIPLEIHSLNYEIPDIITKYSDDTFLNNEDIYEYTDLNKKYKVFLFKYNNLKDNNGQTEYTINYNKNTKCDILIVGGGGGGGTYIGGGGGGGGVLYIENQNILKGNYSIKVGNGGNSVIGNAISSLENNGKKSEIFGIKVYGGGYGGVGGWSSISTNNGQNGSDGGSGGGGGSAHTGNNIGLNGNKILPDFSLSEIIINNYLYYGNNGFSGMIYNGNSAGSIGANGGGGAGENAPLNIDQYIAGNGGNGIRINIDGNNYYWGGGGGGGQYSGTKAGNGGLGGGGGGGGSQSSENIGFGGKKGLSNGKDGSLNGDIGGDGGNHTGGGGGGVGRTINSPNAISGSGGSGIVIIRTIINNYIDILPMNYTLPLKLNKNIKILNYNLTNKNYSQYIDNIIICKYLDNDENSYGQTEYILSFNEMVKVDILIVGGGGSGGFNAGAGGGAGGLIYGSDIILNKNETIYIYVGKGGIQNNSANLITNNGTISYINYNNINIIASGGGAGGYGAEIGLNGGSGGGGASGSTSLNKEGGYSNQKTHYYIKNNIFRGYGNVGGIGRGDEHGGWTRAGGGGGGAGKSGNTSGNYINDQNQSARISHGGDGGEGKDFSDIFGNNIGDNGWFAGGGGGGIHNNQNNGTPGKGGKGGGSDGSNPYNNSNPGINGTGGGGGAGGGGSGIGGNGGDGIILIKYTIHNIEIPITYPININGTGILYNIYESAISDIDINDVIHYYYNNCIYEILEFKYKTIKNEYYFYFTEDKECDILVVGGGGSGGGDYIGGGGGSGSVIFGKNIIIPKNINYNILVGNGGSGVETPDGNNGENSIIYNDNNNYYIEYNFNNLSTSTEFENFLNNNGFTYYYDSVHYRYSGENTFVPDINYGTSIIKANISKGYIQKILPNYNGTLEIHYGSQQNKWDESIIYINNNQVDSTKLRYKVWKGNFNKNDILKLEEPLGLLIIYKIIIYKENNNIDLIESIGGGAGASYNTTIAKSGGSGGGAYIHTNDPYIHVGHKIKGKTAGIFNNVKIYGNNGGRGNYNSVNTQRHAGGGGGAMENGKDGYIDSNNLRNKNNGGNGIDLSNYFGNKVGEDGCFGGGGGGGSHTNQSFNKSPLNSQGGLGGGGYGGYRTLNTPYHNSYTAIDPNNGLAHTGSGGGGAGSNDSNSTQYIKSGSGGSGVILIKYKKYDFNNKSLTFIKEKNINFFDIKSSIGYNTPYSYKFKNSYFTTNIDNTSFLNNDFMLMFWFKFSYNTFTSITFDNEINIKFERDIEFNLKDGNVKSKLTSPDIWYHYTFIRKNNYLYIYINNIDLSIEQQIITETITTNNLLLSIFKSNNSKELSIADFRIYKEFDQFTIERLVNISENNYFRIGANHVSDISPSILYNFKMDADNSLYVNSEFEYIQNEYIYTTDSLGLTGQTEYNINFAVDTICDILIVAGGGGGGTVEYTNTSGTGGGGGGGGVIFLQNQTISSGTYIIKVGKGGKGDDFNDNTKKTGQNGYNSTFSYLYTEAIGGGGGGSRTDHDPGQSNRNDNNTQGNTGGSGGGSSHGNSSTMSGGLGTISDILLADETTVLIVNYRQGYNGGTVQYESPYSSGGGGAGGNGNDSSGTDDGNGGIGRSEENGIDFKIYFNIESYIGEHHTDNKVYFAGGGSSGYRNNDNNYSNGGLGGGGSSNNGISQNGASNTGGGGGGARSGDGGTLQHGGDGGSGIIIIKYKNKIINNLTYNIIENNIEFNYNTIRNSIDLITVPFTLQKIQGFISPNAYNWNNDNDYINLNNHENIFKSFYTGFEISIVYWKKINTIVESNDLNIITNDKTILNVKTLLNGFIEVNFNIIDNNKKITTKTSKPFLNNKWYLIVISAGLNDNHISLSIGLYDNTYTGNLESFIGSSIIYTLLEDDNFDYNISKSNGELKIGNDLILIADIRVYNKFINPNDIYKLIYTNDELFIEKNNYKVLRYNDTNLNNSWNTSLYLPIYTGTTINDLIYNNNYIIYNNIFNVNLDFFSKFYKIEFTISFWKKDNFENNVSDFSIDNCLKFIANKNISLQLFNNTTNIIITNNINLDKNKWYNYIFSLNYNGSKLITDIYIGNNYKIIKSINNINNNFIPFYNNILPNYISIGLDKYEEISLINKSIGNFKIFPRYIPKFMIENILRDNNEDNHILENEITGLILWYRFQDFENGLFNNIIKDSNKNKYNINIQNNNLIEFNIILISNNYTLSGIDDNNNIYTNTISNNNNIKIINVKKRKLLKLNILTNDTHPFIIVKSDINPVRIGNDSIKYENIIYNGIYNNGLTNGYIEWNTNNSSLGRYYGICINHENMYFIIDIVDIVNDNIIMLNNSDYIYKNVYPLLNSNYLATKILNKNFKIETPIITENLSKFTIMLKIRINGLEEYNILKFNNLILSISQNNIKINISETINNSVRDIGIEYNLEWHSIILNYNNNISSIFIDGYHLNSYKHLNNINFENNKFILFDNSLNNFENYEINIEDFRLYNYIISNENIIKYSLGNIN